MDRSRNLLALRTIDVSYRSAIRHAPRAGPAQQEWLGMSRHRAEQQLNALESQVLSDRRHDPELLLQFRVVRDGIRRADQAARGIGKSENESRDAAS